MSTQTLVRLVIAAALLVLAWIAVGFFSSQGTQQAPPASSEGWSDVLAILASGADAVTTIRMEDAEGPRVLSVAADGAWMVNGFLADSAVVDRFWTTAAAVELGDLAAANPSNHERMGVAGDSAISVTLSADEGEANLIVGSRGQTVGTAYARLPSEDEVYILSGGLQPFVARSEWEWRDKRMTVMDTAAIEIIDVDTPDYDYSLVRQEADSIWTLGGDTVQTPTVIGLLEELSNMVASGALAPADSLALEPVAITITALGAGGDTVGVATLGAGEGERAGRTPGKETIYRIPNFRVDRLAPSPDLLIPE